MPNIPPSERKVILLTGVTGGLGGELLPRLLRAYPHHHVVALIRGPDEAAVAVRLQEAMDYAELSEADRDRVQPLRGEVSSPSFGLGAEHLARLAHETAHVFHLAASVDFDLPLPESRYANVESTRELIAFSRECLRHGAFRLNYVSTSFVVGNRRGLLREDELQCGQRFWNAYEQSKAEAEALVVAATDIPTTIYRPSQIIGESRRGRIRKFFGYYEFLKLAARGKMPVLVADPQARTDMVPSDFVCDALIHLSQQPDAIGRTFHLTAGLERSISFERIFDLMFEEIQARAEQASPAHRPRMFRHDQLEHLASKEELRRFHLSPLKILLRTYLPYLDYERDFDSDSTHARLASAGIEMAPIEDVLRATTRYAIEHRHGDQPKARGAQVNTSDVRSAALAAAG